MDKNFLDWLEDHVWLAWGVLAIAGGIVSAPHSLRIILSSVELPDNLKWLYAAAVFVSLELAMVALAFAISLKKKQRVSKQFTLAGLINAGLNLVGVRARIDLSHVPEKVSGNALLMFLFATSLILNLADVFRINPFGTVNEELLGLAVRAVTAALGPVVTLLASHRLAEEVILSQARKKNSGLTSPNRNPNVSEPDKPESGNVRTGLTPDKSGNLRTRTGQNSDSNPDSRVQKNESSLPKSDSISGQNSELGLNRNGDLEIANGVRKLSKSEALAKVRDMLKSGHSADEISEAIGRSRSTTYEYISAIQQPVSSNGNRN